MAEQVIVGDADVSRAAFVRRKITNLVKAAKQNTFEVAALLFEAKKQQYFAQWGFESFTAYGKQIAKDYDFKWTKIYYLVRIMENMEAAKLTPEQYEGVGLAKLRAISRLKPFNKDGSAVLFNDMQVADIIRELTLKAGQMTIEEVQYEVDKILGLADDESMTWLNIKVKRMAKENVIVPALELAKKHIGSIGEDPVTGEAQDASDGRCLELICANFLADPNYNTVAQAPDQIAQEAASDAEDTEATQDTYITPEESLADDSF